ncbi:hypothetical protein GCM10010336_13480 [Streptomyces goshikiensis]|nr:hypothetical protein GCM10010336_13480 [Streptomyces goshikiensis]
MPRRTRCPRVRRRSGAGPVGWPGAGVWSGVVASWLILLRVLTCGADVGRCVALTVHYRQLLILVYDPRPTFVTEFFELESA